MKTYLPLCAALVFAASCIRAESPREAAAPARTATPIKDQSVAAAAPENLIDSILSDSDRAIAPRPPRKLDLELPPEGGMPLPAGIPDDGTVWPVLNQWDESWEERYSVWVEKAVDEDFMVRHKQWSDCADFPYIVRFIFARMNYLPQGCHDRFGNPFGQWSTDFRNLPRGGDWDKDRRFLAALDEVKSTVQCRSMPFDTYPIAILPQYGFLRPGAVVTNEMHSLVITRVDRRDFFPIWLTASTLPPAVRKLTVEALNDGMEFSSLNDFGFVDYNWWTQDPATRVWTPLPDDKMPGWSLQQYKLMLVAPKLGELRLSGLLQKLYAYKATDGAAAFKELSADLRSVLGLRQVVVNAGIDYYRGDPQARGDLLSDEYDEYSTHGRDGRLRVKFANLHKLVELGLMEQNDLNERLAGVSFDIAPGQTLTLLELDYALRRGGISPEPWDTLWQRWGAGEWRLLAEIVLDRKYSANTQPAPGGGLFAETSTGALTRFDAAGKMLWTVAGAADSAAAIDPKSELIFKNDSHRALHAYNIFSGQERWHAEPAKDAAIKIAALPDAGIVVVVTQRGGVIAHEAASGKVRWETSIGGYLAGAAAGPNGPIAAITADGALTALGLDKNVLFTKNLGFRVQVAPLVDAQGNVYALSERGEVAAFDAQGNERWRHYAGGRLAFPSTVGADGMLYLAAGSSVVCMMSDGFIRWSCDVGDEIYAAPAVGADGSVCVATLNHMLYAIDARGKIKWAFEAPSSVLTPPVFGGGGSVYLMPGNGRLLVVRGR